MDLAWKESPILNFKSHNHISAAITQLLLDLDNTIYPSSSLLADEMHRRMNKYVADYLNIPEPEAKTLRIAGFTRHGTTLRWLQLEQGLAEPLEFLEYVHPADIENYLQPVPNLRSFLQSIPLPKSILTNSPRNHALRILEFYGIRDCFDQVFDLTGNNYVGKPNQSAYDNSLQTLGRTAAETLFVDDIPGYLETFNKMGGHCILVDEKRHHGDSRWPVITSIFEMMQYLS